MRKAVALSCLLSLAACASGPSKYVTDMQAYQGKSEAQLIDALGPPDNQYEVDGAKYLTYSKITQQTYPTGGPDVAFGGFYPHRGAVWIDQGRPQHRRADLPLRRVFHVTS